MTSSPSLTFASLFLAHLWNQVNQNVRKKDASSSTGDTHERSTNGAEEKKENDHDDAQSSSSISVATYLANAFMSRIEVALHEGVEQLPWLDASSSSSSSSPLSSRKRKSGVTPNHHHTNNNNNNRDTLYHLLQWTFAKNVDVFELYIQRNIVSLPRGASFSRRQALVQAFAGALENGTTNDDDIDHATHQKKPEATGKKKNTDDDDDTDQGNQRINDKVQALIRHVWAADKGSSSLLENLPTAQQLADLPIELQALRQQLEHCRHRRHLAQQRAHTVSRAQALVTHARAAPETAGSSSSAAASIAMTVVAAQELQELQQHARDLLVTLHDHHHQRQPHRAAPKEEHDDDDDEEYDDVEYRVDSFPPDDPASRVKPSLPWRGESSTLEERFQWDRENLQMEHQASLPTWLGLPVDHHYKRKRNILHVVTSDNNNDQNNNNGK